MKLNSGYPSVKRLTSFFAGAARPSFIPWTRNFSGPNQGLVLTKRTQSGVMVASHPYFGQRLAATTIVTRPPTLFAPVNDPDVTRKADSGLLNEQDHAEEREVEAILEQIAAAAAEGVEGLEPDTIEGSKNLFANTMLVGVQHTMGTTVSMLKVLKKYGLQTAIIGGKSYSTHQPCVKEIRDLGYTFIDAPDQLGYGSFDSCMKETVMNIWADAQAKMKDYYETSGKQIDLLIVLDDGGDLLLSTPAKLFNGIKHKPNRLIGIEQTRGGSNQLSFKGIPFPIINVAGSYVKTTLEYPWVVDIIATKVANAVHEKAQALDFPKKPIIGVVGNGTMGQAIIEKFVAADYLVLVHDKEAKGKGAVVNGGNKNKKVIWAFDTPSLISKADIIIGCTGTDITADLNTLAAILTNVSPKIFVSASSKDIEFNTLLLKIQEQKKRLQETPDPLADIEFTNPDNPADAKLIVLRGGFPINFDNERHCVPPDKIWTTRAGLLSACIMAVKAHRQGCLNTPEILQLDAQAQLEIFEIYKGLHPADAAVQKLAWFGSPEIKRQIIAKSEGIRLADIIRQEKTVGLGR